MNKYEFIEALRRALTGKVNKPELDETIRYYEDYIDVEIKKGRAEEEVLESLGDPWVLAKSISVVHGSTGEEHVTSYHQEQSHEQTRERNKRRIFRLPVWLVMAIVLVVVLGIVALLFSVISLLLPVIIPMVLILVVVNLIGGYLWRR